MILAFEGGRGLAAILVALYHLLWAEGYFSAIRNGYIFVDLFFVLSGFLMYSLYAKKLTNLSEIKPFVIRRFGRLFPLMAFSTIFYIACQYTIIFVKNVWLITTHGSVYASAHHNAYPTLKPSELASTLTFTNGLGFFNGDVLNAPTWSISTEFYTYIFFALCCYLIRGKKLIWFLSTAAISTYALTIWASVHVHECLSRGKCLDVSFDFGLPRCISGFFLGALAAWFCQTDIKINMNRLQIVGFLLLFTVLATMDKIPALAFFFPVIFSVLVISVSTDEGIASNFLKMKFIQLLGKLSFSIYLMHACVLLFFREFLDAVGVGLSLYLFAAAYVLTIIIISRFTYTFIEDPFRSYFNRIANKYRDPNQIIDTDKVAPFIE